MDPNVVYNAPANSGRKGSWNQTALGGMFWAFDPRPEEVFLADIAKSLSKKCRFNGNCKVFYSVAEHSLWCSWLVPDQYALEALLHDAAEAYISDMIRPLKVHFPEYRAVEDKIEQVIAERFELTFPFPPCIKEADQAMLHAEKEQIMMPPPADWCEAGEAAPAKVKIAGLEWRDAETLFVKRYFELADSRGLSRNLIQP